MRGKALLKCIKGAGSYVAEDNPIAAIAGPQVAERRVSRLDSDSEVIFLICTMGRWDL